MDVEFDSAKDEANIAKHGVSLAVGAVVLQGLVGEAVDTRRDYGEVRINAFGMIAGRLFCCTYTLRGTTHRIISVRKANQKEQARWLW